MSDAEQNAILNQLFAEPPAAGGPTGMRPNADLPRTPRGDEQTNIIRRLEGLEPIAPPAPAPARPPQTTLEYLGDTGRAIGAGLARNIPSLMDTPQVALNAADSASKWAMKKLGLGENPSVLPSNIAGYMLGNPTGVRAVRDNPKPFTEQLSDATGGYTDFRGNDLLQRSLGTAGEFVGPGIVKAPGIIGKGIKLATQALLPAASSEVAGDLAKNYLPEGYEGPAKLAGAIVGGGIGAGVEKAVTPNFARGTPGADVLTDTQSASQRLKDRGFKVSAGQEMQDPRMRAFESADSSSRALNVHNQRAYNREVMKSIGSDANLLTPETLDAARKDIGKGYNDVLEGTDIIFTNKQGQKISETLRELEKSKTDFTPSLPRGVQETIDDLLDFSQTGAGYNAQKLWATRSDLGRMGSEAAESGNKQLVKLTGALRATIDDAIDETLLASFRFDDAAKLATLNEKYRNLLAVEEAHAKGLMDPSYNSLAQAGYINAGILDRVVKDQDIGYYLKPKKPRDLSELNKDMTTTQILQPQGSMLSPDSVVRNKRGMAKLATGSIPLLGGAGAMYFPQLAQMALANPIPAAGAALAAAIPFAAVGARNVLDRNSLNPIVQAYQRNQLVNPSSAVGSMLSAGAKAERAGRKSGGRVDSHEVEADHLVRAAERAKKGLSAHTEGLLNTPDDAVASALEVANRSI